MWSNFGLICQNNESFWLKTTCIQTYPNWSHQFRIGMFTWSSGHNGQRCTNSWHVFTNSVSTNIRFFFSKFHLITFLQSTYEFLIEIKLWKKMLMYLFMVTKKRHFAELICIQKASWAMMPSSSFLILAAKQLLLHVTQSSYFTNLKQRGIQMSSIVMLEGKWLYDEIGLKIALYF